MKKDKNQESISNVFLSDVKNTIEVNRADYGTYLIKKLAKKIEPEYGTGFGIRQLERARQFYREYPIASAVRTQLNWSQYKLLISIQDIDKRKYYELEAENNSWTVRELKR